MTLTWSGSCLTGTVTESRIALNDDGTLKKADPSETSRQAYARLTNLLSIIYKGVKLRILATADQLIREDY